MSEHSPEAIKAFPKQLVTTDIDNLIAEARKYGPESMSSKLIAKLADALVSRQTTTRKIAADAWDEGAQSRQCHCNAWTEGECACGGYPSERNPYRASVTAPTETEKP